MSKCLKSLLVLVLAFCAQVAMAQKPIPYGQNISVENAKKVAAAALAEARKNNWRMAVAVVDASGFLVYYEKMENTQLASAAVSIDKARSAVLYKRSNKEMQDGLAAGGAGWRLLRLRDAVPVDGGEPLILDNKIIGAIGVSGEQSNQDEQCTQAGVNALK